MFKRYAILSIVAVIACGCVNDTSEEEEDEEEVVSAAQALHPSGICRIEGDVTWSGKRVKMYHISAPNTVYHSFQCGYTVGTSECCHLRTGYSEEQCQQWRHEPDCPKASGGDPGGGDPPTQQL